MRHPYKFKPDVNPRICPFCHNDHNALSYIGEKQTGKKIETTYLMSCEKCGAELNIVNILYKGEEIDGNFNQM